MERKDNLWLWEQLEKTDPTFTREVKFGRKFTDINPTYRIKRLTEALGPEGQGFGFKVIREPDLVIIEGHPMWLVGVSFWWSPDLGETRYELLPTYSLAPAMSGAKPDDDALKKVITDCKGKIPVDIGLCADIYMGQWDTKYSQPAKPSKPNGDGKGSAALAISKMWDRLRQEFGHDGMYKKEDGEFTEVALAKQAVVAEVFAAEKVCDSKGTPIWKKIQALDGDLVIDRLKKLNKAILAQRERMGAIKAQEDSEVF